MVDTHIEYKVFRKDGITLKKKRRKTQKIRFIQKVMFKFTGLLGYINLSKMLRGPLRG